MFENFQKVWWNEYASFLRFKVARCSNVNIDKGIIDDDDDDDDGDENIIDIWLKLKKKTIWSFGSINNVPLIKRNVIRQIF